MFGALVIDEFSDVAVGRREPQFNTKALIPLAVLSTSTVLLGFLMVKLLSRARKFQEQQDSKMPRTMSFTSASMAFGAFPTEAKVVDPIINVVMLFPSIEKCPTAESLVPMAQKILEYERCAGVPEGTVGRNDWRVPKSHTEVDPKQMIRVIKCHCNSDEELFREAIEVHWQDSLRECRHTTGKDPLPWWEFLIFENKGSGSSVVMFRLEHSLGDGLAIVTLFEQFLTYADGTAVGTLLPQGMVKKFEKKPMSGMKRIAMSFQVFKSTLSVLSLPASKYDDGISFRSKLGIGPQMVHTGHRKTLLFHNTPITFIKDLKNEAHVTLNDIVYTALSQALHDYCKKYQDSVLQQKGVKTQFRALMPFAFPRPEKETSDKSSALRNKWVFISSDMGIGHDNLIGRLKYIHESMDKIKHSPTPFCQLAVQSNVPPYLPTAMARKTVYDTFTRHSMVFSNVPGPNRLCAIAGHTAAGVHFLFNNLLPQVNVLTYNGFLFMNMVVDHDALPDCDHIPILFSKALVDLAEHFKVPVPSDVALHASTKML